MRIIRGCVLTLTGSRIAFTCEVIGTYYLDLLSTKGGLSKHLSQEGGWGTVGEGQTIASGLLLDVLVGFGNSI